MHPGDPEATLDPQDQDLEAQMDFFHKLGYSTAQVQAVQQKFGPFTDTDKVLGELVRVGASPETKPGPVTTISVLVPRGGVQAAGATLQLPLAPENSEDEESLRPVVIDGSNVAMSHGNKEVFSCLGIQLSVSFFLDRGHTEVTVFVPSWRKEHPRPDAPITDQHILRDLERKKILVFTPSRRYAGKRVVCNDDVFIVKLAYETDGIIVSNDMYRDLQGDRPEWKCFIEERLLMYSFVNNKFMPPDDPLGRHGPTLENFLRKFPKTQKKQQCPYGKKCTYGVKCKFLHPERAKQLSRSVADEPRKNAKRPQRRASCNSSPQPGQSLLMVEDMAQKLSLGQESSSVKKDPRPEHVKSSQCSSRRTTSRKERPGQYLSLDHSSGWGGVCEEQLDSGLGSIDSQLREAPRSQIEHQYGASLLSCQTPCVQPHYCPPTSVPCSCCPHGPHCQGPTPALQHHTQHQSLGLVSGHGSDVTPYAPPQYQDCGPYRLSVPAYSEPVSRVHTCQHQMFWSDPYRGHPLAVHSRRGECSQWEPDGGGEERQVVRKKLLAIFSAHLVDMAMDLFPHIMDPQLLVAEILMLQGQNRVQR